MAISRTTTWSVGQVLTAAALNDEFNNILNNGIDLWSPAAKAVDFNGFEVVLDADGDTSLTADTDDQIDIKLAGSDAMRLLLTSSKPDVRLLGTAADYNNIISDVNGNELLEFQGIASAVNQIGVSNNSTGARPRLEARGETNVSLALRSKGTGEIVQEDSAGNNVGWAPRSYLAGLTMSTAGSSSTMTVAAGMARDGSNAKNLVLTSAIGKTTSSWAVGTGNGGLDTGSIANSTWYHFWLIMRSDTGVVDVLISTSASSPTMPTNYDYKRRIGSGRTNGSAQWTSFTQDGDYFVWTASVEDFNVTNPGSSAVSRTLTVPTGVNVWAIVHAYLSVGTASRFLLSDLAANDENPAGGGNAPEGSITIGSTQAGSGPHLIRTNTSAQVRTRVDASDASTVIRCSTHGWYDRRGRDA